MKRRLLGNFSKGECLKDTVSIIDQCTGEFSTTLNETRGPHNENRSPPTQFKPLFGDSIFGCHSMPWSLFDILEQKKVLLVAVFDQLTSVNQGYGNANDTSSSNGPWTNDLLWERLSYTMGTMLWRTRLWNTDIGEYQASWILAHSERSPDPW